MNIMLLLLGPGNLRRSRFCLTALGFFLLAIGAVIIVDASDTVTLITLEGFGWVMVAVGLMKLAFSVASGSAGFTSVFGAQGFVFVILGYAIADFPLESRNAVPWLFGVSLLLNGMYQIVSSTIIRYPLWGWFLGSGIGHVVLGGFTFLHWKDAVTWVIPLFLGAGFFLGGISTLYAAMRMGRYLKKGKAWDAEMAIRYFLDFHVPRRFRKQYFPADPKCPVEVGLPHGDLLVHVWTPTTVAKMDQSPNPVSRYVAAQDPEGSLHVGHAALEMTPDIYVSHCDGDSAPFTDGGQMLKSLRSTDGPGLFLVSFEEEVRTYMLPSVTIRFRNFKEDQIRTFWAIYRLVTDYNFTNRNCSVAVALVLDAALMGSLAPRKRLLATLDLLTKKDLWVAHFIRWKAREMVWTPGLILEYALALQRLVEVE
jgi:uncharacterized membrane protein HdeD (DUF308 family)